MDLKSRNIFKNISFKFLFFIIAVAIFVPLKEVNAAGWGDLFSMDIFGSLVDFIGKAALDDSNSFFSVIFFIAYQVLNTILLGVTILVYFGAWLVDVFLDENIYMRVLDMSDRTSAISIGWTVIRDACNTFFVLFLLLIAFSTILRIQTFNAKSLLPRFIIALFLINFSAIIAMLVIDFGQVFMFEIRDWLGSGGFSQSGTALTSIVDYFNNYYNFKSPSGSHTLQDVVGVAFAVFYSALLGFMYIMLALFLLIRVIVFVILVIISPFAFFSIILPGMRTYTSQWWSSLVSHALFGPIFLFFIFLSTQMARSMYGFTPLRPGERISSLQYIIAELIPNVVALGMLAAAIPVTQKLGVAGANKLIGGTAGIGKIAIGTYAGVKLAGGLGKKAVGEPAGRIHSGLKGRSKKYNDLANWTGGKLKSSPIGGRIFIKREAEKAEEHKEAVAKHEKIMGNLSAKDKKAYVDSFKLDKKAQAEATMAMFNLLAKDAGKDLTNERLKKLGYEKNGKYDEKRLKEDYNRVLSYGHDTTTLETYRPDLIKDKDDRIDKIKKIVADNNERNIKLDALADEDIDKTLKYSIGDKQRYDSFIKSKSQEEKNGLIGTRKEQLADMYDSKGNVKSGREEEALEHRREIFNLSGSRDKLNALNKIEIKDGKVELTGPIDAEFASSAIEGMNVDDFVNQDKNFLGKFGYMIDSKQIGRIKRNKYTTAEQTGAIENSIVARLGYLKDKDNSEEKREKLKNSLEALESSITRVSGSKKKGKEKEEEGEGERSEDENTA